MFVARRHQDRVRSAARPWIKRQWKLEGNGRKGVHLIGHTLGSTS
jgi:hypothetical protein